MDAGENKKALSRVDLLDLAVFAFIIILIFWPVMVNIVNAGGDYSEHIQLAERMEKFHRLESPHFFFELCIIALHAFLPGFTYYKISSVFLTMVNLSLGLILFFFIRSYFQSGLAPAYSFIVPLVALGLMIVSPITFFTWSDNNLYYGYLHGANVYHNPTIILIKPLSLLLFWLAVTIFVNPQSPNRWGTILLAGFLTLISAISKPNYVICILPALAIGTLYSLFRKKPVNLKLLMFSFLFPSACILVWQYHATFSPHQITASANAIAFRPFLVYSHFSSHLLGKFTLSILFPFLVYILYLRQSSYRDLYLNLAWITFGFGLFYSYFLVESGTRILCGNFIWSGQITLFILFAVSAAYFLRQEIRTDGRSIHLIISPKFIIISSIFILHLINGAMWYYKNLTHAYQQNFW